MKGPAGEAAAESTGLLPIVLKLLACAAISSIAYAIFTVLYALMHISPRFSGPWLLTAAAVASGLLGCTAALLLGRSALPLRRRVLLLCSGGAAVSFVFGFFYTPLFLHGLFPRLVTVAACVFTYGRGCVFYSRRLKVRDIAALPVALLLAALGIRSLGAAFPLNGCLWLALSSSAAIAALFNYESVDRLMIQSGRGTASLPPRIRAQNLLLLTGFTQLLVLLVLLRRGILKVLAAFWRGISFLLNQLALFIQGLFRGNGYNFNIDPNPGQQTGGVFQSYGPLNVLAGLLAAAVLVALFLLIRKSAGRFIREKLASLLAVFRRILTKNIRVLAPDISRYYRDEEERLSDKEEPLPELSPDGGLKKWRRDCRKWKHLANSREKFSFGYRLSREGLRLHGIELPLSATPLEVLELSRKTLPGPAYETATWCLNAMEYSPREPIPAIPELEETLSELRRRSLS